MVLEKTQTNIIALAIGRRKEATAIVQVYNIGPDEKSEIRKLTGRNPRRMHARFMRALQPEVAETKPSMRKGTSEWGSTSRECAIAPAWRQSAAGKPHQPVASKCERGVRFSCLFHAVSCVLVAVR